MTQPILRTERLLMVPLADEHLELEVELDSDPEVLRYLWGRSRSREEVVGSHAERLALGRQVDGLGYWMAFLRSGNANSPGGFVGLMMLPPAHGPDQRDDRASRNWAIASGGSTGGRVSQVRRHVRCCGTRSRPWEYVG